MQLFRSARKNQTPVSEMADDALIAAIAGSDMAAFEELHSRYFPKLMRFASRIIDSADTAEEVASDALMTVWRTAERFEGRSKPSTWMFGIAYRMALKARQKAAKRQHDVELDEELIGTDDDTADTVIIRTDLANALKRLKPDIRAVVELTYFNGYIYTEIAEILECPVGTVKTRMMAARRHLRKFLADDKILGEEQAHG